MITLGERQQEKSEDGDQNVTASYILRNKWALGHVIS